MKLGDATDNSPVRICIEIYAPIDIGSSLNFRRVTAARFIFGAVVENAAKEVFMLKAVTLC